MSKTWNADFTKVVPSGAAGGEHLLGIFFENEEGRIRRLTQAVGLNKSFNPETEEIKPIGQEAAETLVKGYNESFDNDLIIRKDEPNYEFFNDFLKQRPTGENAKLKVYTVDFMEEELGTNHNKYLAYFYFATCTVTSGNYTDGRLAVNFTQAGDRTTGIIYRIDDSVSDDEMDYVYEFKPSKDIDIVAIKLSDMELAMAAGKERTVAVSFSPLGSSIDFIISVDDPAVCRVKRLRQSVVIRALSAGEAEITVQSTEDVTKKTTIDVTVTA